MENLHQTSTTLLILSHQFDKDRTKLLFQDSNYYRKSVADML